MSRIFTTLTLLGLSAASGLVCFAQSAQPVTVTGCLTQGDEKNEYAIKDSSGKTYGLVGTKVDMKSHLNHEVTITGTPVRENEKNEKNDTGKAEESDHLSVTKLTMVSPTCK
ncbi:MAG TPA: hypothetical protein VN519_02395 [Bryobacteraceae bacterium]|nr:hypothetical protein [Bryobacteraceae bacterium]